MYYWFSNDCYFSAFIYRADLYSFFIKFILYRLFFWHNKFSMLICRKDDKVTWVQSYVALPLLIKILKLLFWNDFANNFNLLNFALLFRFWFFNSRVTQESSSFKFCFCCSYSVLIVFNVLFLFSVCQI